jgi:iron complex transport system substrate-binding protein
VLTADPHTLSEVLTSITTLGSATGHLPAAERLLDSLEQRLAAVRAEVAARPAGPGPRVLLLEWTDPPFAPGHWVPEMVTTAGGRPTIGAAGEKSVRVTWEQALATEPDVVVCAPCGYDLAGSVAQASAVVASGVVPAGTPVWAVDANASFARPGPRLVDGIETLARIFDPAGPAPAATAAVRVR